MNLVFTPEAEQQADECDRWWRENRDARDLFARELADAKLVLREAPNVGSMYTVLDELPVRRVLLRKTGTHVYYSIDRDADFGDGPRRVGRTPGSRAGAVTRCRSATERGRARSAPPRCGSTIFEK